MQSTESGFEAEHSFLERVAITVSDRAELRSLRKWLEDVEEVRVDLASGTAAAGELGLGDFLVMAGSSTGLVAAVNVLPAYIKSRRPGIVLSVEYKDLKLKVDAQNVEDCAQTMRSAVEATKQVLGEVERHVEG